MAVGTHRAKWCRGVAEKAMRTARVEVFRVNGIFPETKGKGFSPSGSKLF
jgi:hypothetical protein